MRKERRIPMLFLAVVLVAAITLPQGFAITIPKLHPKSYTSHPVPWHSTVVQPAPNSTVTKAPAREPGNVLVMHGVELLGNQVLEVKEGSAFATIFVNL